MCRGLILGALRAPGETSRRTVYGPGICPFADQNKTQTMMLTFLALGQAGFQPIVGQTASLPARTKSIEYSADIGFGQVQKW